MARILVGWDGSEASDQALVFAARLAQDADDLIVATVVPARLGDRSFLETLLPGVKLPADFQPKTYEHSARDRVEERVRKLETDAKVRTLVRIGDPADELLLTVRDEKVDHLIVGYKSYETTLPYNIGSVAEKLVRYAGVPITVHHAPPRPVKREP